MVSALRTAVVLAASGRAALWLNRAAAKDCAAGERYSSSSGSGACAACGPGRYGPGCTSCSSVLRRRVVRRGQVWYCDGQDVGGEGVRLVVRHRNRRWALRLCDGANVGSNGLHGRRVRCSHHRRTLRHRDWANVGSKGLHGSCVRCSDRRWTLRHCDWANVGSKGMRWSCVRCSHRRWTLRHRDWANVGSKGMHGCRVRAATIAGRYATATGQTSEAKACTGVACDAATVAGRYASATGQTSEAKACTGAKGKFGTAATGRSTEADACASLCSSGKFGTVTGKLRRPRRAASTCMQRPSLGATPLRRGKRRKQRPARASRATQPPSLDATPRTGQTSEAKACTGVACGAATIAGRYATATGQTSEAKACTGVACDAATIAGRYATATGQTSEAKACTGVACGAATVAGRYASRRGKRRKQRHARASRAMQRPSLGAMPLQRGKHRKQCTDCAKGKFGTAATGRSTEADACATLCSAGKFGTMTGKTSEAKACGSACSAGKYATATGQTSEAKACTGVACDAATIAGRYATATGQTSEATACVGTACDTATVAGKYATATGQTSSALACTGVECSSGRFGSPTGETSEANACPGACVAGTYQVDASTGNTDASKCSAVCSAGKFGAATGLIADSQCDQCSAGKFSAATGLTSDSQCSLCSGVWGTATGLTSDEECYTAYVAALPACAQSSSAVACAVRSANPACTDSITSCCAGSAVRMYVDATVTAIAANAYEGCTSLALLKLDGSVGLLTIGDRAFRSTGINTPFGVDFGVLDCATITSGASAAPFAFSCPSALPTLEFYWDLTGASGGMTIADSIAGVVATLTDGATRTATGVVLDGVNGYVDVNLDAKILGGAVTIVGVVKWNAFNQHSRLFDCGNGQDSDNILMGNEGTTGQFKWTVLQGTAPKSAISPTTSDLSVGVRYHIVATISGTTMITYINGVKKGERTTSVKEECVSATSEGAIGRPTATSPAKSPPSRSTPVR